MSEKDFLKRHLMKMQHCKYESLANNEAENIAFTIICSSLTVDDKQKLIDRYTSFFIDRFNYHMAEFSKMSDSELRKLLSFKVRSYERG